MLPILATFWPQPLAKMPVASSSKPPAVGGEARKKKRVRKISHGGTGKKTQAVRGDVATGSMPMKQPESKQKKDDKKHEIHNKSGPASSPGPAVGGKVLSQLLAVLAAELVQPPLAESLQHKFKEGRLAF